jgi:tellurite resistance protein/DNA-directed RNA polymerase subunit RPC12/RpoP
MSHVLREAWCAGDMKPARSFVSDGVYSRFAVQLELMRSEGVRNVMRDAKVLYTTLEAVSSYPPLDAVHVRFTASARDTNVAADASPDQIARALAATCESPYTEIWTLVRRQGATTKRPAEDVGRACPSCGAPFEDAAEMLVCKYCKALVCSGEHDWVLSEITQLEEWRPSSVERVPGLDELRGEDLGAAREALEDRASYVFWKWVEAARRSAFAPLRKCATRDFIDDRARLDALAGARDVAVGGADLLLVDVGADEADAVDQVYVRMFWSARFLAQDEPTPMQSILKLVRKSGTVTKLSMTAVVCNTCGAPLQETDSSACEHCRAEVVAGGAAWVLDAIVPPSEVRTRHARHGATFAFVPDMADPRERALLFSEMARLVAINGRIERREKRMLTACAAKWNIPEDVVAKALEGKARTAAQVAVTSPEWFLAGLVGAAMADGSIDDSERAAIEDARVRLGLGADAIPRAIEACRSRMAAADAVTRVSR